MVPDIGWPLLDVRVIFYDHGCRNTRENCVIRNAFCGKNASITELKGL